ncbi:MAG: hypothetical protein CMJ88_10025 [Planctomycetes bacterium]|nr:hypothetical protein [Planctomycetota bacterium]
MDLGSILLAVFGIGLLIFIHEGGHFLAARSAGVHVEVFSLGFGPRLAGFRWRGTDFRLSAVPFGGYVMVAGQDPADRRFPAEQCLWSKSVGQRALFWSAGVIMNALFALVTFPLVFSAGVRFEAPVLGDVLRGSPAWEAGLQDGERIVEVAGKQVYSLQNLMIEVALSGKRPVELLVESPGGERRVVTARPRFDAAQGLYGLGIGPAYDREGVELTVADGGPAAAAGLRTGDRLLAINGDPDAVVAPLEADDACVFRIEREGREIDVAVTPGPDPQDGRALIGVRPLPNRVAGIRSGAALVQRLGLRRGDVVLAIEAKPFLAGDLEAFSSATEATTRWRVLRDARVVELRAETTPAERKELADMVALDSAPRLQVLPMPDSAATASGLRPGDWVETIDGRAVEEWEQLRQAVQRAGIRPIKVEVRRPVPDGAAPRVAAPDGARVSLTITPRMASQPDFGLQRTIPPLTSEIRAASFGDALRLGTICSLDLVKQLYVTLKRLITGEVGAKNLGGIIRISQVSYQAAQRGPSWFWYFLALLSVNLAFVNLLPVPVLDGGHLLFLLIEKVKGSPVSTRVFGYSQVIGLVFVLLLVLFVTYNDILRLL